MPDGRARVAEQEEAAVHEERPLPRRPGPRVHPDGVELGPLLARVRIFLLVEPLLDADEDVGLDDRHDVREPHHVHVREEHVVAEVEHDPHARALQPHHVGEAALREAAVLGGELGAEGDRVVPGGDDPHTAIVNGVRSLQRRCPAGYRTYTAVSPAQPAMEYAYSSAATTSRFERSAPATRALSTQLSSMSV